MKNLQQKILGLILISSTPGWSLTLEEATRGVNENSHELKQLGLQIESSQLDQTKARAGYLPKIDMNARHLFKEHFEELEIPFGAENFVMPAIQPYTNAGITATLNIFNGFQTTYEMKAAENRKRAADHRLKRAQERKYSEIRTLFYRALGSQTLVDVASQNVQTLENHLNDVNARLRSGVSTRYDALRVDVQLEDAKTEKFAAESNVAVARAKLFQAMDRADDGTPLQGKMADDFGRIEASKLTIDQSLRADRSVLIAERDAQVDLARAARGKWMPSVSLFGNYDFYNNYNHSVIASDEHFKSAYAMGLTFQWNLYDGGADSANDKQIALASSIAEEKLAELEQSMPANLEEARRRFSYHVMNYKSKLSSIRKAEEAVRLAQGGLKAGTLTNTDVLDAVVEWNRAKATVIKSQIDAIDALGQLELAVGHVL